MSSAPPRCPLCGAALPDNPSAAGYCPSCNSYFAAAPGPATPRSIAPAPVPGAPFSPPGASFDAPSITPIPTAPPSGFPIDASAPGPPFLSGAAPASRPAASSPPAAPIAGAEAAASRLLFLVAGLVATALGAAVAYYGTATYREYLASETWPRVEGQIRSVEGKRRVNRPREGEPTVTYDVSIVYSYEHGGNTYSNSRLAFGETGVGLPQAEGERLLETYKHGTKHPIFVNPETPAVAVLERRAVGGSYLTLGFGLLILYVVVRCLGAALVPATWSARPGPFFRGLWKPYDVWVAQYGGSALAIAYVVASLFF